LSTLQDRFFCRDFLLCFFFALIAPLKVSAAQYYFDNSLGNDEGAGSIASPWKTVLKANSLHLVPGDALYLKRGETWHETLVVPSSGDKDNPVLLGAYGEGPPPIIDATRPASGQWLEMGKNRYAHPWPEKPYVLLYDTIPSSTIFSITLDPGVERIPEPGAILLQVKKGTPYTNFWVLSVDSATKTLHGITNKHKHWDTSRKIQVRQINLQTGMEELWPLMPPPIDVSPKLSSLTENGRWYWQEGILYIFSDIHPEKLNITVGSLDYGIDTNKQNNLIVRDIMIKGANISGILVNNTRNSLIENMTVYGIGAKSYRAGIMLLDSSSNSIYKNTIDSVLSNGIVLYGLSGLTHHNSLTANTITNSGSSGILVGGEEPFRVASNHISENTVLASNQRAYDSAGIYVYFCGEGNVIENNIIKNGGTRFLKSCGIMADTDAGPVTIVGNRIENNSFAGIAITESRHRIINNHLVRNYSPQWKGAEILFFPVNEDARQCEVRDNQLESDHIFFRIEKGSTLGHVIDQNTYTGGSAKPFYLGKSLLTFQEWQKQSPYDRNSRYRAAVINQQ
jgi:hypothetical protein